MTRAAFLSCLLPMVSFGILFGKQAPAGSTGFCFTENKGQVYDQHYQTRPDVLFYGETGPLAFHLTTKGISYQIKKAERWTTCKNPKTNIEQRIPDQFTYYRIDALWKACNTQVKVIPGEPINGYSNFYLSVCPNGVHNVKSFKDLWYKNIYDGIDLHYFVVDGQLKYDYLVAATTDYRKIQLEIKGAISLNLSDEGTLMINTPLGMITEARPTAEQDGRPLVASWKIKDNTVSYEIEGYNPLLSLRIDPPVRVWGTYYGGGSDFDYAEDCATDPSGNVFMTGHSLSSGLATAGAHQSTKIGNYANALLVKFNGSGSRLWSTYYGSPGSASNAGTNGYGCATDANGNSYMCGRASASNSTEIATNGSHQPAIGGFWDAFLVKFDVNGVRLWGTYYGGTGEEQAYACGTDLIGNVYMIGNTSSTSNISSASAYQPSKTASLFNAFLVKFNTNGTRVWGTYYGDNSSAWDCAVETNGNIVAAGPAGNTGSPLLTSPGCHQPVSGGGNDCWLAKFDANGARLWGTLYGGTGNDIANACAVDPCGNVYLSGHSNTSTGIAIATAGAHQPVFGGGSYDGYLVKFSPGGVRQWGTYYGAAAQENQYGCATDQAGDVYIAGYLFGATSGTAIATPGSHQPTMPATQSAYLAKFNTNGQRQWGTYYGFDGTAIGNAFACSAYSDGSVYLTGIAQTPGPGTFTTVSTPGAHQPNHGGGVYDAFLVKFSDIAGPSMVPSISVQTSQSVTCAGSSVSLTASGAISYTWNTGSNNQSIVVSPNTTSTYTVIGTGTQVCQNFALVTVSVNPGPTITLISSDTLICSGNAVTLTATGANLYTWLPTGSGNSLSVSPMLNTTYSVTGFNNSGCSNSAALTITVVPSPSLSISSTHSLGCSGQNYTLSASGAASYSWHNIANSSSIVVSTGTTTTYTLTGQNSNGCSATSYFTQSVLPSPLVTIAGNINEICAGKSTTLTAQGATSYQWLPAGTGSLLVVTPLTTTIYTVTGTATNGCSSSATATVMVFPCVGLEEVTEPNQGQFIVYPNPGKGQFIVVTTSDIQLRIYDALGKLVTEHFLVSGIHVLDLTYKKAGTYILETAGSGSPVMKKLILLD